MAAGTPKAFSTTSSPTTPSSPAKGVGTSVIINSTQSECDYLDITGWRFLSVKPSASVTSITFYASETPTGTYSLVNSLGTNGVVTVVASVWNSIDYTKLAVHRYIQMKSDQSAATASVAVST